MHAMLENVSRIVSHKETNFMTSENLAQAVHDSIFAQRPITRTPPSPRKTKNKLEVPDALKEGKDYMDRRLAVSIIFF